MIAALSTACVEHGKPLMATGSAGQVVIHPLISEVRTHRMVRNTLWRQLALPDEDGRESAVSRAQQRSAWGRDAARARWGR